MFMLRELRKAKGLTLKELGELVGVAESTISQYETEKREPDFETLLKFGEIFDVSVDYLLRGDVYADEQQDKADDESGGDDAGVLLDTLIDKLKKEETIQFNGYSMTRETAELLAASLAAADDMTAKLLKEKQQKEE